MKTIGYGISNFIRLRQRGHYFIDKTRHINEIERLGDYILLIRPRRMGKSLWLQTMAVYYDINHEDKFEELFAGTKIFDHPTPLRNQFLVLMLDFSVIDANPKNVEQSFNLYGNSTLYHFVRRYPQHFSPEFCERLETFPTFASQLNELLRFTGSMGYNIYILIDEYDNFTNTILSLEGHQTYSELTKATGFYRNFFAVLKGATQSSQQGEVRLFITGVSPVTMDDVTSGFNIGKNISLRPAFQELLGFTEREVCTLLEYYQQEGVFPLNLEQALALMKKWYNNYRFSANATQAIFNSDMVLYFVDSVITGGTPPEPLIDRNVRIDYGKLRFLLMEAQKLNGNFNKLRYVIANQSAPKGVIQESFPAEKIAQEENFYSLLFYFGLLTYQDPEIDPGALVIPNQTVRQLMYSYLREGLDEGLGFHVNWDTHNQLVAKMATDGDWTPFFDHLANKIKDYTSIRDFLDGEKMIQGFLLAYLCATNLFVAHTEWEANKGYADFFLMPLETPIYKIRFCYLIELKYISRSDYSQEKLDAKVQEAKQQLAMYQKDQRIHQWIKGLQLKSVVLVFKGWELVYKEEL